MLEASSDLVCKASSAKFKRTVEIIIVIYVEWHMVPMLSDRMAVCISVDRPYGGLDHRKCWTKSFNLLITS